MKKILTLTAGILSTSLCLAGPGDEVDFPADYLTNFTPYMSVDRTQNPDQVEKDADGKVIESTLGQRLINKLALLAVMERREGAAAEYPEGMGNDDWDFAAFKPNGDRANKDLTQCAACHAPHKDSHHLFSYQHIIAEQNRK